VLVSPKDAILPGLFSEKKYLYSKEVFYIIKADRGSHVFLDEPADGIFNRYIYKVRSHIINSSFKYLSPENQILMKGIVFGSKASKLKDELKNKIQDLGLNHITSASGFNVAILSGAIFYLFRIFKIPNVFSTLISIILILFYIMLASFSSSVMRAAIFLILLLFGNLFNKKIRILPVTSAIFLMFFIYSPFQILDIGLQLSIIAFLALAFYQSRLKKTLLSLRNKFYFYSLDLIFQSVIIQFVIMPIIVFYFHNIQFLAIPANIVAVPLAGFLLTIGIPFVFIDALIQNNVLSKITCSIIQAISDLFLLWIDWLYKFPFRVFYFPALDFWMLLLIYILIVLILYTLFFYKLDKKTLFLISLNVLLIVLFSGAFRNNKNIKIFFVPKYNQELIFMLLPNSKPVVFLSSENNKNINFIKQFFKINNILPDFSTCILKNNNCSLDPGYFEADETKIRLKYKKFSIAIIKNYNKKILSYDTCIKLPMLMRNDPALNTVIKGIPEILVVNDYKKLSKKSIENIKWLNKQNFRKIYLSMSGTVALVTDGLDYYIKGNN
jgi:competence protein ComEC